MGRVRQITASNLEITPVKVTLMKSYRNRSFSGQTDSSDFHFLCSTASHGVVSTGDDSYRVSFHLSESHGTIFRVIGHFPYTSGSFHQRLIPVGIKDRNKNFSLTFLNGLVLVKVVSAINKLLPRFFSTLAVAYIIIIVRIISTIHGCQCQFTAGIVNKAVISYGALARSAPCDGASQGIIGVFPSYDSRTSLFVIHALDQITLFFIGLCERYSIWLRECMQKVGSFKIGKTELFFFTFVQESCGSNKSILPIAGENGLFHNSIFGISVAGTASQLVTCFRNHVGFASGCQAIGLLLAVFIVADGSRSGGISYLNELAEMIVRIGLTGSRAITEGNSGQLPCESVVFADFTCSPRVAKTLR